jgi:hypothetical protein
MLPLTRTCVAVCSLLSVMMNDLLADPIVVTIATGDDVAKPDGSRKWVQEIIIHFSAESIIERFVPQKTYVCNIEVPGILNTFDVQTFDLTAERAQFTVRGETESAVLLGGMPSINYSFNFDVSRDGSGTVSGCHDGYPSYQIDADIETVYKYEHPSWRPDLLIGDCGQDNSVGMGPLPLLNSLGRAALGLSPVMMITISTKIEESDPQSGVKSVQFVSVNFDQKTIKDAYRVGSTTLCRLELPGVSQEHEILSPFFSQSGDQKQANFLARGRTESYIPFVSNAVYSLAFLIFEDNRGSVAGCHSSASPIEISVNGKSAYLFAERRIFNFFADCDNSIDIEF